jgi:hypothetical protein
MAGLAPLAARKSKAAPEKKRPAPAKPKGQHEQERSIAFHPPPLSIRSARPPPVALLKKEEGIQAKLTVSEPDDELEKEADQVADKVMMRMPAAAAPMGDDDDEPIQTKLTVSEPGDPFEREADRVADEVMRMPDPGASAPVTTTSAKSSSAPDDTELQRADDEDVEEEATTPLVQRMVMSAPLQRACASCSAKPKDDEAETKVIQRACSKCDDEMTNVVQRMCSTCSGEKEKEHVQTKRANERDAEPPGPTFSRRLREARGAGGSPLPSSVRSFMEPRFREDFSGVRVHNDARAESLNRSVSARAFTTGHDIFFRPGEFRPNSASGRRLIAHELTHVVQQRGSQQSVGREVLQRRKGEAAAATPDLPGERTVTLPAGGGHPSTKVFETTEHGVRFVLVWGEVEAGGQNRVEGMDLRSPEEIRANSEQRSQLVAGVLRAMDNLSAIGKRISDDNALLTRLAGDESPVPVGDFHVRDCFVVADAPTTGFRLWEGVPVLLLDFSTAHPETAAHEMGHAFDHYFEERAEATGADHSTQPLLVRVAEVFARLALTRCRTKFGITAAVGHWAADPTEWMKDATEADKEHPWDNPDEFFASAKAAFQTDKNGLKNAIARMAKLDRAVSEPWGELLKIFQEVFSAGRLPKGATPSEMGREALKANLPTPPVEQRGLFRKAVETLDIRARKQKGGKQVGLIKLTRPKVGGKCRPDSKAPVEPGEGTEETLPRKEASPSGRRPEVGPDFENKLQTARKGAGESLPISVRQPFEQRLGERLAGVRIHTDARADSLNRAVEARAFTAGNDIFFRSAEFRPRTDEGKRLIAHELAHVVQQKRRQSAAGPGRETVGTPGAAHAFQAGGTETLQRQVGPRGNAPTTLPPRDTVRVIGVPVALPPDPTARPITRRVPNPDTNQAGAFGWFVRFSTTARSKWLIQEVRNIWNPIRCGFTGHLQEVTPHYWEAWWIDSVGDVRLPLTMNQPPATQVIGLDHHDRFTRRLEVGTRGNYRINARLYTAETLPPGFALDTVNDAVALPATTNPPPPGALGPVLHRRFAAGVWRACPPAPSFHDAFLQRKPAVGMASARPEREDDDDKVFLQGADGHPGSISRTSTFARQLGNARRSGGIPLPRSVRGLMEPRFGQDLGPVKIHADGLAETLSETVNARAFTVGHDVFFGRSEFKPDAPEGQRLLAHELTHVVQQQNGHPASGLQRQADEELSPTDSLDALDESAGTELDSSEEAELQELATPTEEPVALTPERAEETEVAPAETTDAKEPELPEAADVATVEAELQSKLPAEPEETEEIQSQFESVEETVSEAPPEEPAPEALISEDPGVVARNESVARLRTQVDSRKLEIEAVGVATKERIRSAVTTQKQRVTAALTAERDGLGAATDQQIQHLAAAAEAARQSIVTGRDEKIASVRAAAETEAENLETVVGDKVTKLADAADIAAGDVTTFGDLQAKRAETQSDANAKKAQAIGAKVIHDFIGRSQEGRIQAEIGKEAAAVAARLLGFGKEVAGKARSHAEELAGKIVDDATQTGNKFKNEAQPRGIGKIEEARDSNIDTITRMAEGALNQLTGLQSTLANRLKSDAASSAEVLTQLIGATTADLDTAETAAGTAIDRDVGLALAELDAFVAEAELLLGSSEPELADLRLAELSPAVDEGVTGYLGSLNQAGTNAEQKLAERGDQVAGNSAVRTSGTATLGQVGTVLEAKLASLADNVNADMDAQAKVGIKSMADVTTAVGKDLDSAIEKKEGSWRSEIAQGTAKIRERVDAELAKQEKTLRDLDPTLRSAAQEIADESILERIGKFVLGVFVGAILTAIVLFVIAIVLFPVALAVGALITALAAAAVATGPLGLLAAFALGVVIGLALGVIIIGIAEGVQKVFKEAWRDDLSSYEGGKKFGEGLAEIVFSLSGAAALRSAVRKALGKAAAKALPKSRTGTGAAGGLTRGRTLTADEAKDLAKRTKELAEQAQRQADEAAKAAAEAGRPGPEPVKPAPAEPGLKPGEAPSPGRPGVGTGNPRFVKIRDDLDVGKNRTVAIGEASTTEFTGEVIGASGDALRGTRLGNAIIAPNTTRSGPGRLDAEVKVLDFLETKLTPNSRGTINLIIDNKGGACENCGAAILRFREKFPNVRLNVSIPE